MNLDTWIRWAFRPCKSWHPFPARVLARQAARDLGQPVSEKDFCRTMSAAGFKIAKYSGNTVFYLVRDTAEKLRYFRQKYLAADDKITHPLSASNTQVTNVFTSPD